MKDLGWIALAGACGTVCRFLVSGWVQRFTGIRFPWGTVAVNLAGCFLFGLIWALAEERFALGGRVRVIVLTGFMGAFTTFSTFAFETTALMRESQWGTAVANLMLQNIAGIAFLLLGMAAARIEI